MTKPQKNLDTLFALEFGQMLENHLYGSPNKDELKQLICSCFQLKSENQLAQIFTGFDTPTTAAIFELIRTLNDDGFTQRFFMMQTTNVNSKVNIGAFDEKPKVVETNAPPPIETEQEYADRINRAFNAQSESNTEEDEDDSEFGDIDMTLL